LSWRARVWAWLSGSQDGRRIIPLGQRSPHLLRDIGLDRRAREDADPRSTDWLMR